MFVSIVASQPYLLRVHCFRRYEAAPFRGGTNLRLRAEVAAEVLRGCCGAETLLDVRSDAAVSAAVDFTIVGEQATAETAGLGCIERNGERKPA